MASAMASAPKRCRLPEATRKQNCIFKNYFVDSNCTRTDCLLYPKLSVRGFTYTNNADKYMPRCEYQLSRTGYYQYSNLSCNPFQLPLKEIVARDIRRCAEEECSNYSLRYLFQNICQCNMDTLRGILPSFQGYNNICCRPHMCKNSQWQKDNEIDIKRIKIFEDSLVTTVKKARHIYASDPFGINGFLNKRKRCKPNTLKQVRLVKDGRPSIETKYLFRKQLMNLAKRKFEENKDLISSTHSHDEHGDQNELDFENMTGQEFPSDFIFGSTGIFEYSADVTTAESEEIPDDVQAEADEKLLEQLAALTAEIKHMSDGETVNKEEVEYFTPEREDFKAIFSNEITPSDEEKEPPENLTEEGREVYKESLTEDGNEGYKESAEMVTDLGDHVVTGVAPSMTETELNDEVTTGKTETDLSAREEENAVSSVAQDEVKTASYDHDKEEQATDLAQGEAKINSNLNDIEEQAEVVQSDNEYEAYTEPEEEDISEETQID